jgi:putative tricarboxylic transport membrane protein
MMDILHNLAVGLSHLLGVVPFSLLLAGIFIGVVAGALPGISFVNAMALALPFTYVMEPTNAMVFLAGLYCGGVFGGSISSILINIPGSPGSLPATWDGYPMTQRGESARALGIAITCSAIGGIGSALMMIFVSPPFANFALRFGQPEFFAATVLGLVSVVAIAKGKMLTSMISLFMGLTVGAIGLDPLYAIPRLTFGWSILENGVSFVVVLIGMFAIGEVLGWVSSRSPTRYKPASKTRALLPSVKDLLKLKGAISRGTGIGCVIGAIPGTGAIIGAIISYGIEKQVSKRGNEFGTGVEEGLAAPETAKNATTGTATIPLLTLGIPGSAATAIMLAALMLHGVNPGPMLFITGTDLIYTVFAAYLVANILMIAAGMLVARAFTLLMAIPPGLLFGFIAVLCLVGAFGVRNNMADVYICIGFGILGFLLQRYHIPTAPLILGVILGPLAERYFLTSMIAYDNNFLIFFTRPLSGVILFLAFAFLAWSFWESIQKRFKNFRQHPN